MELIKFVNGGFTVIAFHLAKKDIFQVCVSDMVRLVVETEAFTEETSIQVSSDGSAQLLDICFLFVCYAEYEVGIIALTILKYKASY